MDQKKIILLLATYGIVQVLAQDLGIPSGNKQVKLIKTQPIEAAILYAGGYTVSEDHTISMIALIIYYFLKYVYSDGLTK
tara:strand:- start:87 stop:326 length:240 start_codon:yes stop_codon:yes gene_type:complete